MLYGAILGDMIGAPYEFDRGDKTKFFMLFSDESQFTDDTVMTIAIADALMNAEGRAWNSLFADYMKKWGSLYPNAGYGARFQKWLRDADPKPYNSFGNGSAMRVSSVAWMYDDLQKVRQIARASAAVTHSHPEGIKGADCTASLIWLARNGYTKRILKQYAEMFGYDLSRTCDEIRPSYFHDESCQHTVPEAITAFLEGNSFEDVIRTAVSLGGDSDTLTCIAGSIAEAFYGVPDDMKAECRRRLTPDLLDVLDRFTDAA